MKLFFAGWRLDREAVLGDFDIKIITILKYILTKYMLKPNQQFINDIKIRLKDYYCNKNDVTNIEQFPLNAKQCLYVADWQNAKIVYQRNVDKILGYNNIEFTLEKILGIAHPEDLDVVRRITQAIVYHLTNHTQFSYDDTFLLISYRFRKKDGSYLKILRQSTLFEKVKGGALKSNLSLLTDISSIDTSSTVTWDFIAPQVEKDAFRDEIYKEFSDLFSVREKEVIKLIASNDTTKQIAVALFISEHTVYTHRKNILKKANCRNAKELIEFCKSIGAL